MTEEVINYRVEFDVRGADRSIRSTQRVLYAMNALRLSIVDFQRLSTDPSLGNLLWTGIQLTRTWRLLYNLVTKTNQAQRIGVTQGVARGVTGGITRRATGVMGTNLAMRGLFGEIPQVAAQNANTGIGSLLTGVLFALPPSSIGLLLGTAVIGGYYLIQRNNRIQYEERQKRNREIAKSQGWEY